MQLRALLSLSVICTAFYCSAPGAALAQTPGFITGQTIVGFDPATGQILNTYTPASGDVGPTVVSKDGTMLYSPQDYGVGYLQILSVADGSTLGTIPGLSKGPMQARLSPSGNFLYEIGLHTLKHAWISAVDLKAGKAAGYIHVSPGYPYDLAVSPDGTKLFVASHTIKVDIESVESTEEPDTTGVPVAVCPLSNGICVFDTTTFALTGYVLGVTGYLNVSQDGKSLYCVQNADTPDLAIIDVATLKVSYISIFPAGVPARMAVSPTENQAVVLAGNTTTVSMFIINTLTNEVAGSFPAPVPAGPPLSGEGYTLSGNAMAFSRDGTSLWSIINCQEGACLALAGQKFPSGEAIAQVPVPQVDGVSSLAF